MLCQHEVVNCRLHVDEGFAIDNKNNNNDDDDDEAATRLRTTTTATNNDDEQRRTTTTTNDDDDDDDDERRRRRRRRRQRTSMFSRMKIRGAMVCSLIPFISVLIISVPSVKFANPSLNPHTSTSLFYPINTRTSTDQFCRTFRSTVF